MVDPFCSAVLDQNSFNCQQVDLVRKFSSNVLLPNMERGQTEPTNGFAYAFHMRKDTSSKMSLSFIINKHKRGMSSLQT